VTPFDVVCDLRNLLDDTVKEYLWSDYELEGYLAQAYKEFARVTQLLVDMSTANVAVYAVSASSASIALSPLVVDIRRAFDADNNHEFARNNSNKMPMVNIKEGEVRSIIADREKGKLHFNPIPAADFNLTLQIARFPLEEFSQAMANPLEYTDDRAWNITILYAASRAYLKDDVETVDRVRAQEFMAQFRQEADDYRLETNAQRREPGTVQYGGY
jgi:hypothetical protein